MNENEPLSGAIGLLLLCGLISFPVLLAYIAHKVKSRSLLHYYQMENEALRDELEFENERRQRAQKYYLDKIHTHDKEFIDYQIDKKMGLLGLLRRDTPPQQPHRRITVNRMDDDYTPPRPNPRPQSFRQPETHREPPPREIIRENTRVVFVHEPPRPTRKLPFFGRDDDVIDITPNEPVNPHKPMLQLPFLGATKKKGGRPRKHNSNADRQRDYNNRKKGKS